MRPQKIFMTKSFFTTSKKKKKKKKMRSKSAGLLWGKYDGTDKAAEGWKSACNLKRKSWVTKEKLTFIHNFPEAGGLVSERKISN